MDFGGLSGVAYTCCYWFVKFCYVNLLWILFTLVGMVLFGVGPATVAMFTIMRHWLRGNETVPVFSEFGRAFKKEFIKSNAVSLILLGLGYILYMYFLTLQSMSGFGVQLLYFASLSVLFLYVVVLFYVFPVYVHYKLNIKGVLKQSFLIGISYPLHTFTMILGSFIAYLIVDILAFQFFFVGSTISFVIMLCAIRAFTKLEYRVSRTQEEKPA
ncbi:YesL family protein [Halobacillus andaensis]|uniref:YesL family protein n=1 Tax=Halobacillus andaensis TaxID=1176239 RepID=UPI003D7053D2